MTRLIAHAAALSCLCAAGLAHAATLLRVDASALPPAPLEGHLQLGTAVAPSGSRIAVNNRYLSRDGQPWMPVMGEFHYVRTPASQWETELRKMKAAGIDIVASYVMWNYHEPVEGRYDWQGERDLRRFVALAAKAGLHVMVRIGPWVHAEVRYGGIPDWVVDAMPSRTDDPVYLSHVARLYGQIGAQLKGQLWKDGGPVIGVQIENEYNLTGPGEGAQHIATLKALARKAGIDAPLYTVTGWDRAKYPPGEVTPVFGGYPDEPWAKSTKELAPKETYAFRFDSRVSGDLGAQTAGAGRGTADTEIDKTPFFGAEYGAGLPFMYRRRPVVSPADVASMLPVQLGSGVNLLGYYMFHGGRNRVASPSLEENTHIGAWNDTPMVNYDFQAPLGPDGQEREVLRHLRPFHLFLRDFGARLAPMVVYAPERVPAGPADLQTPRLAVRSDGRSGFLFVNNHVRQYAMPVHKDVRFAVRLGERTLTFPSKGIDIADGAFFMWPLDFDMDGTRLRYATAQPVARLDSGREGIVYVFAAHDGIPVELAFDDARGLDVHGARVRAGSAGETIVDAITPGKGKVLTIARANKAPVHVVVLRAEESRQLSIGEIAGKRRLVLSGQQTWFAGGGLELRGKGEPLFNFAVYPALARAPRANGVALQAHGDGIFALYRHKVQEAKLSATFAEVRPARAAPPVAVGGVAKAALQPAPEAWRNAAGWRLDVPRGAALKGLDDALLEIDFVGDIGRLFDGTRLLDDWYYSGYGWEYSLRQAGASALSLSVMPLRQDAPVYIPAAARPDFGADVQRATLRKLTVTPVYRVSVRP